MNGALLRKSFAKQLEVFRNSYFVGITYVLNF